MRLANRRILITGGASGIGLATAARFVREGARVAILDRDADAAERAAAGIKGAKAVTADVRSETDVARAVKDAARALGGLDGLVNSAGIDLVTPLVETKLEDWHRIIEVNLTGPFLVCRAAVPELQMAKAATIVNIASGAGLFPLKHRTAYCSAKAGIVMFTKTLAMELAPKIRVNVVCPGAIETPLFRSSYENAADPAAELARITARYTLGRVGEPDEIADAVLFLTSEESSYVTGSALAVDGGRTFH